MPPPLPDESDAESAAEQIPPTNETASAQVDEELKDAAEDENQDEEEEEDDEEDAEVYVVESILDHRSDFEDGVMRYNVKWKGYEKKSDRTWETEENLEGARLVLEAYWKKIGGRPTVPTKVSKKRSRQSLSGNGTSDTTKKQKRGRKSNQAALSLDQTPEPPAGFTQVGDDDWKPPPPNKDAWDPLVQAIDTIERDEHQELWAYLVWNDKNADGRFYRSKARVPACNQACPQRMLQFYEKHVVFTQNRNNFVDNGQA